MELEQPRLKNLAMTFDEVSMERSKNFVKALQELKNLRPQLYSAAEYCEKSYLHSEQKQMVLDNLKDYAVRALVNAVDHLGTVAYKLNDLLEQQTTDVSTVEMRITCLNQQLLTCQTYTDKEGLRQQQLLAIIPRHHKHYILPNSANKRVHFSPHIQTDGKQSHIKARPRLYPSGTPASNTLSWHLASETKSTLMGTPRELMSTEDSKTSGAFNLLDGEEGTRKKSSTAHLQLPTMGPASTAAMQTLGVIRRHVTKSVEVMAGGAAERNSYLNFLDSQHGSKSLTGFRSFDNPPRREIVRAPVRSKSVLSAFFVKQKTPKLKTSPVS
ncbi:unnamed protein product [Ilex paraguariensis]|uniref:Protein ABIL1 n=1 Tax=Ilex paraguariensis TaxID=185542 RepID=A0ABC8SHW7_9AQUA